MFFRFALLTAFAFTSGATASERERLPNWASAAVAAVDLTKPPEGADLWQLLDETEIQIDGRNRISIRRRLVQYVVNYNGALPASIYTIDGDEETTRVKKLRGWHLDRKGELEKVNKKNAVTLGRSSMEMLTSGTVTATAFERVFSGAIIAFESEERQNSFFPMATFQVMSGHPIRQKTIRFAGRAGDATLLTRGFEGWGLEVTKKDDAILISNVPGLEDESLMPGPTDGFPFVIVRLDAIDRGGRMQSWDNMARWYHRLFHDEATAGKPGTGLLSDIAEIEPEIAWFRNEITYRQRYLRADRGWVPLEGKEVERLAYGDCKDMVSCFAYRLKPRGTSVLPVLANIVDGPYTTSADPPGPLFNHLIAAIPVADSVAAPAVVKAGDTRYLLYDPTDKYTRTGYLSGTYRDRQVMICTPTGALWVAIPDEALEEERLSIALSGGLDGNLTMSGTLVIGEEGNAVGLRVAVETENPRLIERIAKETLGIPGLADLSEIERKIEKDGKVHLAYQISWPSFLRRDEDGFRLPPAIIGTSDTSLRGEESARQNPILFEALPEISWKLTLITGFTIEPGTRERSWRGDYRRFSWKAEGGNRLYVDYTRSGKRGFFPKNELGDGVEHWNAYVQERKDFYTGTLIRTGE